MESQTNLLEDIKQMRNTLQTDKLDMSFGELMYFMNMRPRLLTLFPLISL